MRALETEVVDAVWAAVEVLLPARVDDHPLGCHRPRVADRLCFWGIGLLVDIDTLHLDRGYDYPVVRERLARVGVHDVEVQRRGTKGAGQESADPARAALRRRSHELVVVELRPAPTQHRPPEPAPPRRTLPRQTVLIVGKLITYRDRWSPR
jgi:hypothetical protein